MNSTLSKILAGCLALPLAARAAVFTTDTIIAPDDFIYEGADIVVSNATLTVDGPHTFASLTVQSNGVVTHSLSASGTITTNIAIADEPQILVGTNEVQLANTNITPATVVVQDLSGTVTYQTNVDFVVRSTAPDTFLSRSETSTIPDGAMVLVSYSIPGGTIAAGLNLTITQNLHVALGGRIDASGRGIASGGGVGSSTGSPLSGGGGGHGGFGGLSSNNAPGGNCYGVIQLPTTFGSRGGNGIGGLGAPGGGVIRLNVTGSAQIDGVIAANGLEATNSRAGGGSGGSIWLNAQTLAGNGVFTALGGNGEPIHGGGGGGGRIALTMGTNLFTGASTAYGGLGWKIGGAGTVYTKLTSDAGTILLSNNDRAGANSLVANPNQSDVIIQSRAGAVASGSWFARHVLVDTNCFLGLASPTTTLSLSATTVLVRAGGILNADGASSISGGTTSGANYAGGGHGGGGGNALINNSAGGQTTGSQGSPITFGGRGGGDPQFGNLGGGAGGGAIRLDTSLLEVDGRISAAGLGGTNGGGGAGGSIWITTANLVGGGSINADGGNGTPGSGGGGGGRIAIYVSDTNLFTGLITAVGGSGGNRGGAGTVYLESPEPNATVRRDFIVDNGGFTAPNVRTNTLLSTFPPSVNLIIRNGAAAQTSGGLTTLLTAFIGANSSLSVSGSLNVTSNALVEAGGRLHADGVGFSSLGTGVGTSVGNSIYHGGGGGHGGYGGHGGTNNARGGNSYGAATAPITAGSTGGGTGSSFPPLGGMGGGALRLIVTGALTNNGVISSDGKAGSGNYAGGGAGGSVYLTGGRLYGTGSFTANGGPGVFPGGGGGGGGRIALIVTSNFFTGAITAYGGSGANYGGAGTVYLSTNFTSSHLIVDNGGNFGTNTTASETSYTGDITVAGGGVFVIAFPNSGVRNVTIRTNGTIVTPVSTAQQSLTLSGNLTIDAGGVFSLDGRGYGPGTGTSGGAGYPSVGPRGGGGHGGYGAFHPVAPAPSYGNAYGSIILPATPGSGGGNGSGSSFSPLGGAGGGALRLLFIGNERLLTVNGRLSANGQPGELNSGGGAGGSLQIALHVLAGTGVISASGGAGNGTAGGGGGGRIAITYNSNLFTGQILATGGSGAMTGGAGTIYTKANSANSGVLLIDNASKTGVNTPLSSSFALPAVGFNLTLGGGAAVVALTQLPQLGDLIINAPGMLTMRPNETNVFLDVQRNLTIAPGGAINVDGKGFGRSLGNAPGASLASQGAGGGHGGAGGDSQSGALGGTNYGSITQPVLRGSGGGAGANTYLNGCEGGGAVRLIVGGVLTLDGTVSANGNPGVQDDSGGGAGGSIWISANRLSGAGSILATGGDGDWFGGGGGGGGRIAIYCPTNQFAGQYDVTGGAGFAAGEMGTVFLSASLGPLLSIAGTVTDAQGQPVAGVTLQAISGTATNATTVSDASGNYLLAIPSGWIGSVVPSYATNVLVPSLRSYNTTVTLLNGQNFTMLPSVTPTLNPSLVGTNLQLNWTGFAGVEYWPEWSTNLTTWHYLSGPVTGSNGAIHNLPLNQDLPAKFFRLSVTY